MPALLVGGGSSAALVACAVGFPALRVKGLMLVVATLAFGEAVRLFFFNFNYQIARGEPEGRPASAARASGRSAISPRTAGRTLEVMLFIWVVVALVMAALWWLDRSRAGAVLRAVGEDELAAQSARHQPHRREGDRR